MHLQRLVGEIQIAFAPDVQPQRAAGRVFADIAIVADKLQPYAVEVGDIQRVNRQLRADLFPQLLFGDGQDAHQLIVEIDFQLRLHGQQRGRRGIFQIEQRVGDQLIAAHAEFDRGVRPRAAQHNAARRRRDGGKGQLHLPLRDILGDHRRCGRFGEGRQSSPARARWPPAAERQEPGSPRRPAPRKRPADTSCTCPPLLHTSRKVFFSSHYHHC
ncbi:hypothetical protein SB01124_00166 [Klebsiella quasipneumoniae subsp. quasipneumoniae]|nr:hypothetical protein SB01124_00166 [Klebsiella quasipneumoniae subsp. quasipneumoniae]